MMLEINDLLKVYSLLIYFIFSWTDQQRAQAAREGWGYRLLFSARLVIMKLLSYFLSKMVCCFALNLLVI